MPEAMCIPDGKNAGKPLSAAVVVGYLVLNNFYLWYSPHLFLYWYALFPILVPACLININRVNVNLKKMTYVTI